MRHRREDVVRRALELLREVGLPDLTMRRLGAELGVQPSAIYHHFPNKQALLGAVADAIVEGVGATGTVDWRQPVREICAATRGSVLAVPDGADVVATMWSYGLGGAAPYDALVPHLRGAGLDPELARTAARTLLHYVYGHAISEQTFEQASRLGAIETARATDDFDAGLHFVVAGIAAALS